MVGSAVFPFDFASDATKKKRLEAKGYWKVTLQMHLLCIVPL